MCILFLIFMLDNSTHKRTSLIRPIYNVVYAVRLLDMLTYIGNLAQAV